MNKEKNSGGRIRKPQHGRRLRWGKQFILLAAIAVLALGIVGGTSAYLLTNTLGVTNTFTPSEVKCAVIEDTFNQKVSTVKTNVKIQNTGDTEAYIRAAVIITLRDENGNVVAKTPVENEDYTIRYNPAANGWVKNSSDGYYYYTKVVKPSNFTDILIEECATKSSTYKLSVEILADAIQSNPKDAVKQAWPNVTVNTDGTLN